MHLLLIAVVPGLVSSVPPSSVAIKVAASAVIPTRATASMLAADGTAALATKTAAVVGAGPAGMLTAIMLARRGYGSIQVYDQLPPPPSADDEAWGAGERSYQIGLNGRGQAALRNLDCFERVDRYSACANGRLSFDATTGEPIENRLTPPGEPGAEKSYVTRVLQRDRLQAVLLEEAADKYAGQICVTHGIACAGIDLTGSRPALLLRETSAIDATPQPHEAVDLVIGADGVRSAVRTALETAPASRTRTKRFEEINERRFKTVPLHPARVAGTPRDLNWGYRNASLDLGFDALPTKEGEMVGVLLTRPGTPAYERLAAVGDGAAARAFFAEAMPPLLPYLEDDELDRFAQRPIGKLPSFQMVEGDVHQSLPEGGVVLLGDAIKAVKPYFGQGANSALEDVIVLNRCLDETEDVPAAAARAFTRRRAKDARALVRISRGFDFPGRLGTMRFVLPLILDATLHKWLPRVFTPPVLRALQDEKFAFGALARRKRVERALLVGMVAAFAVALRTAVPWAVRTVARCVVGA